MQWELCSGIYCYKIWYLFFKFLLFLIEDCFTIKFFFSAIDGLIIPYSHFIAFFNSFLSFFQKQHALTTINIFCISTHFRKRYTQWMNFFIIFVNNKVFTIFFCLKNTLLNILILSTYTLFYINSVLIIMKIMFFSFNIIKCRKSFIHFLKNCALNHDSLFQVVLV